MEDNVDAPDGVDLDSDVDMETDGDYEEEEDEEEEDEDEEEDNHEEKDKHEEEDKHEDDGKEPRTIGQGEMVNTWADDVDTMVDDQPIVLPEQGQEMREHTPPPRPMAPAPWPQTLDSRPQPQTPETHPLSGLEHLGPVTPQKPRPAVPTLGDADAAGNTSDVDVDQQLPIESAGGDSLPDVTLCNVPHPDVHLCDAPLPEARPDGSVGEEWLSPHVAEGVMVVLFGSGSGSCHVRFLCSNLFISGIDYYTRCDVFGFLRVSFIYGFCIGCILFIVLSDIAHGAFLQLLACKEPPCDGVEAQ